MELELQQLFHWVFYTRNGMLILCLVCFIAFAIVAVVLETRTRKRFYNHEKKKGKGEEVAKKAGAAARKAADDIKERNIAENGILGGMVDFEDEDDDDEGDDDLDGLFSSLRHDLDDWDEEDEDE